MLSTAVTYGVLKDWSVRSWLVEIWMDCCKSMSRCSNVLKSASK